MRRLTAFVVMTPSAIVTVAGCGGSAARTPAARSCPEHWVAAWGVPPTLADTGRPLSSQTLRMLISPRLAGTQLRVRLSNRFGHTSVTLGPVTVARRTGGASVAPGTSRSVRFDGSIDVRLPPGSDAVSDPIGISARPSEVLSVSIAVPGIVPDPTEHLTTRATGYVSAPGSGDHTADTDGKAFSRPMTGGWAFLDSIDELAPGDSGSLVAFGDSITVGYRGPAAAAGVPTPTPSTGYPEDLQRRLDAAGVPLSVLNSGIGGNRLLGDGVPLFGAAGVSRFRQDALEAAAVREVIVLEGINDIGQGDGITAPQLIAGYRRLIDLAHRAGTRIQLGTITPSGGATAGYGKRAAAEVRRRVNDWIRHQGLADGVVDFDAAVRDPSSPARLRPSYDVGDHLHPGPAGYQAMAAAIDVRRLSRPNCATTGTR